MKLQPHETPTPAAIRQGDNYPDTGGGDTVQEITTLPLSNGERPH